MTGSRWPDRSMKRITGHMEPPVVHIVDHDDLARAALAALLEAAHIRTVCHLGADAFLQAYDPLLPGCLVTEVDLPGTCGLQLQERLLPLGGELPIIFVSRRCDVPMSVRALRNGAVDFLEKPYDPGRMLERIQLTLKTVQSRYLERERRARLREKFAQLSPREREVLDHVLRGAVTKVIARDLNISVRTVDVHRAKIKDKLRCQNSAALVRDAVLAFGPGILHPRDFLET
jgi:FixJ family two-component response regulator